MIAPTAGDGSVPERGHVALSELGLVVRPTRIAQRWAPTDFDADRDHHADGGRWADWRLMDVLPTKVVEQVWTWCSKVGLEWVGQVSTKSGQGTVSMTCWLRQLQSARAGRTAQTLHAAVLRRT